MGGRVAEAAFNGADVGLADASSGSDVGLSKSLLGSKLFQDATIASASRRALGSQDCCRLWENSS